MRWRKLSAVGVAAIGSGALMGATLGTGEHVGFDPKTVTVGEGDGQALVTVARDACSNPAFRLAWNAPPTTTHGSTADDGEDYQRAHRNDVWGPCEGEGRATTVYTVPIIDDDVREDDETIEMSLSASRVSTNSTNPLPAVDPDGVIVIQDDDRTELVTQDVTVSEAAGVAKVPVTVKNGPGEPVVVDYVTEQGTAVPGVDYTSAEDDVTIPADSPQTATIDIPVRADDELEGDEQFKVRFSWGEEVVRATVTVKDASKQPERKQEEPKPQTTTQAAPAPAPAASVASTPRADSQAKRRCISRRLFSIRLEDLRRATVTVDGRRMTTRRRRGRLSARIDLRGRPRGDYTVRIAGVDRRGKRVTLTREFRTCAPRRGA